MAGWREMRQTLAADRARLLQYFDSPEPLWLQTGYIAVWLHRMSHYLRCNGWCRLAGLLRGINGLVTGADLDPASVIGKGLVLPNPQTVSIYGTLGENCTVMTSASVGWATPPEGNFLAITAPPVIGDDVVLEAGSLVTGPVRIGNRVRIGPRCLVMSDVPDDMQMLPLEWRAVRL